MAYPKRKFKNHRHEAGLQGKAARYASISRGQFGDQAAGSLPGGPTGGGGGGGEDPVVPPSGPDYSACDVAFDEGTVETFNCYTVSDTNTDELNAHQGWGVPNVGWQKVFDVQVAVFDVFLYVVQDPVVDDLGNGVGWSLEPTELYWVLAPDKIELIDDDFESYDAEDPVSSTLNGGTGWDSAWVIVNKT